MATARAHRCVMCGSTKNTRLWTVDNMHKVVATYLCKDDAAPLWAVMAAAGDLPPAKQIPIPDRGSAPLGNLDVHKRGIRYIPMEPLTGWAPPPENPATAEPPKAELTDLDLVVIQLREDGTSWEKIGEILEMSSQDVYDQFGHLPVKTAPD